MPGLCSIAHGSEPLAAAGRSRWRPRWRRRRRRYRLRLGHDLRRHAPHSARVRHRKRVRGSRRRQARHTLSVEDVEENLECEDVVRADVVKSPANFEMEKTPLELPVSKSSLGLIAEPAPSTYDAGEALVSKCASRQGMGARVGSPVITKAAQLIETAPRARDYLLIDASLEHATTEACPWLRR